MAKPATTKTRRIAILVFDDVELLDIAGPHEVFATASALAAASPPLYEVQTVAMAPKVRRLGAICTGAFLLGAAGLLDGRRAVTHWNWCDRLAARHRGVKVERDPIYVSDKGVWTSAGVTAGIDMALAMVEEDHGAKLALRTARALVVFRKRPGGQSQFSAELALTAAVSPSLETCRDYVLGHLAADLSVPALAARAGMSPRNFSRLFQTNARLSPAKFVELARLDAARRRLEETKDPVARIAESCGFASADIMARAMLRQLGVTPSDYCHRFNAAWHNDVSLEA